MAKKKSLASLEGQENKNTNKHAIWDGVPAIVQFGKKDIEGKAGCTDSLKVRRMLVKDLQKMYGNENKDKFSARFDRFNYFIKVPYGVVCNPISQPQEAKSVG